jgi:transcriptional regulator with XRE-family HTH domain
VDWREYLSTIIVDSNERERIATEIGIHSVTLTRWASGESLPRSQNMRQLLRALPITQRTQMQALLKIDAPDSIDLEIENAEREIPYGFIVEVLEMCANTADLLRFWMIGSMILQQAVRQMDPERVGLSITIAHCMPPRGGKIRSLREHIGMGTPPWREDLEEKALLLGAESLAGHVTASCRMEHISGLRLNKTYLPAYREAPEESAVVCPIMRASRIAGCLSFSSTQRNYFSLEGRLPLAQAYTNLIALAFDPADFYDPSQIALHLMPQPDVQHEYFAGFRQRIIQRMQVAARDGYHLGNNEAEQLEWLNIEDTLMRLPIESNP